MKFILRYFFAFLVTRFSYKMGALSCSLCTNPDAVVYPDPPTCDEDGLTNYGTLESGTLFVMTVSDRVLLTPDNIKGFLAGGGVQWVRPDGSIGFNSAQLMINLGLVGFIANKCISSSSLTSSSSQETIDECKGEQYSYTDWVFEMRTKNFDKENGTVRLAMNNLLKNADCTHLIVGCCATNNDGHHLADFWQAGKWSFTNPIFDRPTGDGGNAKKEIGFVGTYRSNCYPDQCPAPIYSNANFNVRLSAEQKEALLREIEEGDANNE